MDLFITIFRTIFFYLFISVMYRIMGKREIGKLGIIDLIVSILIAELVAISIEKTNQSIFLTIFPIIILVVIEIVLGYICVKSRTLRNIVQGKPSLIVCDGKINYHEMIKQRYTLDDLLLNLRQRSIKSINEVEYAFLETNGKLSIFKYEVGKKRRLFPNPIVLDGKIEDNYINNLKYTKKEIYNMFLNKNIDINNVFYAFLYDKKIFIIERDSKNNLLNNKMIEK